MRYILLAILLTGCLSANQHLKLSERNLAKAKIKGAVVNDRVVIKTDTIFVDIGEWEFEQEADVDTVYLASKCDSLKSDKKETREKAVKEIQEEVCPDIEQEVLMTTKVTVNDSTYTFSIKGILFANGGSLSLKLSNEPLKITYITSTSTTTVKPDRINDWQKYLLGALGGIVLIAAIFIFKR